MSEKICFVIIGFGKKTDLVTGNTLDLDKTYRNIIQPAIIESGHRCVRVTDIQSNGLIDKSVYALLIQADLVIADISTYDPNVIYELGIRHAVRPFSTIMIKEKNAGMSSFHLDHTRIFTYPHPGADMGIKETERCIKGLVGLIHKVSNANKKLTDSLLYEYIHTETSIQLPTEEFQKMINDLTDKERYIFSVIDKGKECMALNDFDSACRYWEKARQMVPNEVYFIQQLALSKYKSKKPSISIALIDALVIIEELHPTNDPETLGITGAIYKNMYLNNGDVQYLNRAIEYYSKGFKISGNYYTGEDYALCLNMKAHFEEDKKEKIYYAIEAKKTRIKNIEMLEKLIQFEDFEQRTDKKWIFATLAHCYFSIKDNKASYFDKKFLQLALEWEKETYIRSKVELEKYI